MVVAVACGGAAAAEPPGVVTLLEGQAALLRGTTRYALAEGVRLQGGDIVELGDKGLALVEFADGCEVSLGPRSRLYLAGLVPRGGKAGGGVSDFYLMQGWVKLSSGKKAAPLRITTPVFGLGTSDATAVVNIGDGEGAMFVESGEMRVAEGFVKATPASPRLRGGEFFTRKVDQRSVTAARPAPAFVAAMPKAYMDNLPSRQAKFKDRETNPRPTGELAYGDVEMWLKAPPEVRRVLMQRFVQKANRDAEFRQALVANLRSHPEWDPILFPEKYKPKEPPEPKTVQEAGARRQQN